MERSIEVYNVAGYKYDETYSVSAHLHENIWQIYYILRGTAKVSRNGSDYILTKDKLILIKPKTVHALQAEGEVLDIKFRINDILLIKELSQQEDFIIAASQEEQAVFTDIKTEAKYRKKYYSRIVSNYLEIFFYRHLRAEELTEEGETKDEPTTYISTIHYDKLGACTRRVLHILDSRAAVPAEEFSLENLARAAGYSKRYMCRKFSEEIGISIKKYLTLLRIDKAKELLNNTTLPLKDISGMVGYDSLPQFEKLFTKYVGISLNEYRKEKKMENHLNYSFRDMDN